MGIAVREQWSDAQVDKNWTTDPLGCNRSCERNSTEFQAGKEIGLHKIFMNGSLKL